MKFLKGVFGKKAPDPNVASTDIEHINQEMYKKSAELSERNKTLALLQKLDNIILSAITRLNEIAELVTSLLVKEGNFESAAIFLYSKQEQILQRLAFSETEKKIQIPYFQTIPLSQAENLIIQSINERTKKSTSSLVHVLLSPESVAESSVSEALVNVKSVHIYPLVVRNDPIGALVFSLNQDEEHLSEYTRDLLIRLADTIGIALDNALLYNEVQAANARLKQLDKLKDEFVSVASHELRTPMTAIKSYLWMALDGHGGPVPEKQKYYLQRAYSSVDRLMRLVTDVLNVSRIDAGRIELDLTSVALDKLVQEVIEDVTPRALELGVTFRMAETALPPVLADPDKIKEVMFNLIGNSLKFTPKGGIITLSFKVNGEMVETTISDTGPGFTQEDIPKLFQKFSLLQTSFASTNQIQGTGLGLYICKSIIEMHKGKIWATSEGKGKGSNFTFSLKVFHEGDVVNKETSSPATDVQSVGIVHTGI